jgi:enoyl-CoA hydratase/carnithine racemase
MKLHLPNLNLQMEGKLVRVVVKDSVAEIILTRPKKLNAMNDDFFTEIGQAADFVNREPSIHVGYQNS